MMPHENEPQPHQHTPPLLSERLARIESNQEMHAQQTVRDVKRIRRTLSRLSKSVHALTYGTDDDNPGLLMKLERHDTRIKDLEKAQDKTIDEAKTQRNWLRVVIGGALIEFVRRLITDHIKWG